MLNSPQESLVPNIGFSWKLAPMLRSSCRKFTGERFQYQPLWVSEGIPLPNFSLSLCVEEVGLLYGHYKVFSPSHRELWNWDGPSELSLTGFRGLEFYALNGAVTGYQLLWGGYDLMHVGSLQLRESPREGQNWELLAATLQQMLEFSRGPREWTPL